MPTAGLYIGFSAFFLWSPLGNYEKKSCLNKLKFGEASRNQKRSICWKFKLSISLGTQKSAKTPPAVGKMIRPFVDEVDVLTNFFDNLLTNFFDDFLWRFFDEFFQRISRRIFWRFGRFLLTYNLLTIASFRIRVPSILFFLINHSYFHISAYSLDIH